MYKLCQGGEQTFEALRFQKQSKVPGPRTDFIFAAIAPGSAKTSAARSRQERDSKEDEGVRGMQEKGQLLKARGESRHKIKRDVHESAIPLQVSFGEADRELRTSRIDESLE